jgi:cytochrome c oxidase assembly protein subunit 15
MLAPPQPVSIRPRAMANWLLGVAALVFVMIIVGGITRLTESGPLHHPLGAGHRRHPPLNEADWEAAFALYRDSPQYQQVNAA